MVVPETCQWSSAHVEGKRGKCLSQIAEMGIESATGQVYHTGRVYNHAHSSLALERLVETP